MELASLLEEGKGGGHFLVDRWDNSRGSRFGVLCPFLTGSSRAKCVPGSEPGSFLCDFHLLVALVDREFKREEEVW